MGGLFAKELREERFVEAGFELINSMNFIALQTTSSEVSAVDQAELTNLLGYTKYVMINLLWNGSRQNRKYKDKDKDWFIDKLEMPGDVGSTQVVDVEEIRDHYRNIEPRVRVWLLVYKDLVALTPDGAKPIKSYLRRANDILHNEI